MALVPLIFLLASLQSAVPTTQERDCRDDNGVDRCDVEVQAQARRDLGLDSIEAEAAAGAQIYRVLYVDGYGIDLPAIAFERRPGRSPEVAVYGHDGRSMRAQLAAEVWERVRRQARFADRSLESLDSDDGPPVCIHAWIVTVEMANSDGEGRGTVPVRRRTQDACGGELTVQYAFEMARLALEALPPCGALDPDHQRNEVTQLETCLMLQGDRLAAAELRNAKEDGQPDYRRDLTEAGTWRAWLGTNGSPSLTWGDQVIQTERGRNNHVAEFLAARMIEHEDLQFRPRTYEGVSSREVIVEGTVGYANLSAPYRQRWVWDIWGLTWMVAEWTVGPFEPQQQAGSGAP